MDSATEILSSSNRGPVSAHPPVLPRRRKLRKGANSCWACKKRKVKCTFASAEAVECLNCRRRGIVCIGQEYQDEDLLYAGASVSSDAQQTAANDGLTVVRVFDGHVLPVANSEQDYSALGLQSDAPVDSLPTPAFSTPAEHTSTGTSPGLPRPESEKFAALSQSLRAAFPSQRDLDILYDARSSFSSHYFHQVSPSSQSALHEDDGPGTTEATKLPALVSHPLVLVRRLLVIASFLQTFPGRDVGGLSEPLETMTTRLVDTAVGFLERHEKMLHSTEGLECMILQSIVHLNGGSPRPAWHALRKGILIAQLMGIYHPRCPPPRTVDPKTTVDAAFLWFRMMYMDRFLCLLLGLPQAAAGTSVDLTSEAARLADTPVCRLERIHAAIASRILQRNEDDRQVQDFSVTQSIDADLQRAIRILPPRFWLPPTFTKAESNSRGVFGKSVRLAVQLYHYHLITQLHLPYMLRFSAESKHDQSRATCANAGREVLMRFASFHSFDHIACCCRPLDFLCLTGALTLIVAHLDSHIHFEPSNPLAHQRHGDRALLEQVLSNMNRIARKYQDRSGCQCARLVQRLLDLEADAADGRVYGAQRFREQSICEGYREENQGKDHAALRVAVPGFGVIRFARGGPVSMEPPPPQQVAVAPSVHQKHEKLGAMSLHAYNFSLTTQLGNMPLSLSNEREFGGDWSSRSPSPEPADQLAVSQLMTEAAPAFEPSIDPTDQFMQDAGGSVEIGDFSQLLGGPGLYLEESNVQGVDLAFFQNLMRGSDMATTTDELLSDWQ